MAYTTELQQIIHHLRQGGKLKPHGAGAGKPAVRPAQHPSPFGKSPQQGPKAVGGMPLGPPPKVSK